MNTKSAAILIGVIFIAVGCLGFISNPIVGSMESGAIFHTDKLHNAVHIGSGVLFLLVALAAPGATGGVLKLFGLVYLALGIYGLVSPPADEKLFGILMVNKNDNYLHIALGVVIFLAGTLRRPS